MCENWKEIEGYEGLYQVSNLGRVKSKGRHGIEIIRKQNIDEWGYKRLGLYKDGQYKYFKVHRLVSQAFIKNPKNKPTVNHKNGIKDDNRLENLEWNTRSENQLHKYRVLGYKGKSGLEGVFGKDNPTSKPVIQLTKDGIFIREYDNARIAYKKTGVHYGLISDTCNGKQKTSKGFIWKFKK